MPAADGRQLHCTTRSTPINLVRILMPLYPRKRRQAA
jgi:hypothetical protein